MTNVLILGGTTEGRELADLCVAMQIQACICVVSEYGGQLLPVSDRLRIHKGQLDRQAMVRLMTELQPELVFDATHPYADIVSENARMACRQTGLRYQRVLRRETGRKLTESEIWVADTEAAVAALEQDQCPVLVTTGSKELAVYGKLTNSRERVYARVLPSHEGIRACEDLGLAGSHIIAMQGPFSKELNQAMLKQINAGWLVTKESGRQGGFNEKLEAARELGIRTVIIGRPKHEEGITLAEASRQMSDLGTLPERQIYLIGIGMGNTGLMTGEARHTIAGCQAIIGAARMVQAVHELAPDAVVKESYLPDEIAGWLKEHPYYCRVGIVLSGDTGFYSGARALSRTLGDTEETWQIRMLPGISTLSYLCARLGTGWDDVYWCSLHGRDCDLTAIVRQHSRVFCLLGGNRTVSEVCNILIAEQPLQFQISAGEALSYPEERIITGTPETVGVLEWGKLTAVLIERK